MSPKKQIVIFIISSILVSLGLIFFAILPTIRAIEKDAVKSNDILREIATILDRQKNLGDIEASCSVSDEDLLKSESVLISADVPISLISFFEKEAEAANLAVDISPVSSEELEDDLWSFVSFRLSLTGSYVNFMRFFERVETAPFLIEIQNLSIKGLLAKEVMVTFTIRAFEK